MRPTITGSGLERAALCPASAVLPRSPALVSEAMEQGSAVHAYLEAAAKVGRDAALSATPERWRRMCEAIDLERLPVDASGYAAEVAFAWAWTDDTAREIGRSMGREYGGLRSNELAGTADVVGLVGESGVIVLDYKTGWSTRELRASGNRQLQFYALAAARAYGRRWARIVLVHIHSDGTSWFDSADLDELDLSAIASDLAEIVMAAGDAADALERGEAPKTRLGDHCRGCTSRASCPAQTAMVLRLASDPASPRKIAEGILTREVAAIAWEKYKIAKSCVDDIGETLRGFAAEHGPIDLGGGRILGRAPKRTVRKLSGRVAWRLIADRFSEETAWAACTLSASREKVRDAIRPHLAGRKLTHVMNELEFDAAAAGGLDVTEQGGFVKEFIPRAGKKGEDDGEI